jgi:hypothetical protein
MKEYIKTVCCGAIVGACLMQLTNMAVESLIDKHFAVGGEILLPLLLILVGYIGWKFAESYFKEIRYKEIYNKGYKDGAKVYSYKIVLPIEEELLEAKDSKAN